MDHLNLAIDISHGWINGVVELYLLVLIWVLFNIHASASGGWPGGKRFALFPSFLRDSVSQSRSWGAVTYHDMACLKTLTQELEGQEIQSTTEDTPHRLSVCREALPSESEVIQEQEGVLRMVSSGSSELILERLCQIVCILSSKREAGNVCRYDC